MDSPKTNGWTFSQRKKSRKRYERDGAKEHEERRVMGEEENKGP